MQTLLLQISICILIFQNIGLWVKNHSSEENNSQKIEQVKYLASAKFDYKWDFLS